MLVWDRSSLLSCSNSNGDRDQRWAIVDPETQSVAYFAWTIPAAFAPPVYRQLPGGPANGGQGLFCAGHCWLPDGRLLTVGGDDWLSQGGAIAFVGSSLVCVYDPLTGPNGTWSTIAQQQPTPQPFLTVPRWYPSATVVSDSTQTGVRVKVIIAGGVEQYLGGPYDAEPNNGLILASDQAYLTHEAYDVVQGPGGWTITKDLRPGGTLPPNYPTTTLPSGVFEGPALPSSASADFQRGLSFFYYPRAHFLSDGVFGGGTRPQGVLWSGGMPVETAWVEHPVNPNFWAAPHPLLTTMVLDMLEEPTGVLLPASLGTGGEDRIAVIGGQFGMSHVGPISPGVFVLDARQPSPNWSQFVLPPLTFKRKFANSVLLPDGSVVVTGGGTNPQHGGTGGEVFTPEVFRTTSWEICAAESSPRTYHSGVVLLPSGRVASMGGDTRTWDYQVFEPHYFSVPGSRPAFTATPGPAIGYAATFPVSFTLQAGRSLGSAVLLTPGSVTHGHDSNQRLVELPISSPTATGATLATPVNPTKAPRGWYMLFLVDNLGVPSQAAWVQLL